MTRRKSNIELMRIVAMLMIVLFHCAFKSGFSFGSEFSANKLIVKSLWMLGEAGVNLFVLITGYFMVLGRFRWKKLILLVCEVFFYHWLLIAAGSLTGLCRLPGARAALQSLFPVTTNQYWFATVYIILYLLSPYLNLLARAMRKCEYERFLCLLLILFCLLPTALGIFSNTTEKLLYFNRLIWLTVVYFAGGYIRLHGLKIIATGRRAGGVAILSGLGLVASILLIDRFSSFFAKLGTEEIAYFWHPNSALMALFSVGLFGVFLHMRLPHIPAVNRIASTTMGVYLLHDGVLSKGLWQEVLRLTRFQDSPRLLIYIIFAGGGIFIACSAVDLLRQFVEARTLQRLLDSRAAHAIFERMRRVTRRSEEEAREE